MPGKWHSLRRLATDGAIHRALGKVSNMVQVRANQPINTDGSINLDAWLDHIVSVDLVLDREVMKQACEFARQAEQNDKVHKNHWAEGTSSFQTGLE
ncbi:GTP pyrophosphokinase, partial [Pseudomonas coronafaciens pv. atropurpurea]